MDTDPSGMLDPTTAGRIWSRTAGPRDTGDDILTEIKERRRKSARMNVHHGFLRHSSNSGRSDTAFGEQGENPLDIFRPNREDKSETLKTQQPLLEGQGFRAW
ncbi:MAG: hypothetical protein WAM61_04310, partial [Desulfobacterales bacterium]